MKFSMLLLLSSLASFAAISECGLGFKIASNKSLTFAAIQNDETKKIIVWEVSTGKTTELSHV